MLDRLRLKRTSASTDTPLPSRLTGVIAVLTTLVVGLVAVGCGSSSSTKTALSKPQFLAQGNAICAQGNQRLAAAQKGLEKTVGNQRPSPAQITAYVKSTFAPEIQGQINRIRALAAPSGEQATVRHMLDVAQADLNQVLSNRALLTGNSNPFANFANLAHAYGLTACATNG
jgi:hypothetical protein